jgi:uncharacterized protein (DUF4415 family)
MAMSKLIEDNILRLAMSSEPKHVISTKELTNIFNQVNSELFEKLRMAGKDWKEHIDEDLEDIYKKHGLK